MTEKEYKKLSELLWQRADTLSEGNMFTTKRTLQNLAAVAEKMGEWKKDNPDQDDPNIWKTACGCG